MKLSDLEVIDYKKASYVTKVSSAPSFGNAKVHFFKILMGTIELNFEYSKELECKMDNLIATNAFKQARVKNGK